MLTSSLFWTDVKKISLHYGTKNQVDLDRVTLSQLSRYMHDGPFAPANIKPKVEAAIAFIRSGGLRVIVTRPDLGFAAIEGETGTEIVPYPGSPGILNSLVARRCRTKNAGRTREYSRFPSFFC